MTGPRGGNVVTIIRDRWGIGHATAPDAEAAFWAQGWLAASDRLWQMEWDRRRVSGRWAEVAGPAAVAEDRFFRRLDLATKARADWARLGPDAAAMTVAYSRGVNAWLAANGSDLPPEFDHHPEPPEPWEPWHCLAVYKLRHVFMGMIHRKLWRGAVTVAAGPDAVRAMVGDPAAASAIHHAEAGGSRDGGAPVDLLADAVAVMARATDDLVALPDVDGGSNSWAVHGDRTASGKPLLAGDPHRGIEFPNVYYQCHLTCDAFDVIGLAFPGVPGFPHFGHNERVAWCITHGMADDTDVFVETDPVTVERTELISVRGGDDVEVACAATERGPVVLGDPTTGEPVLSMMWTGISGVDTTFECLWPMLTARDVDELEGAVTDWVIPVNNLLCADVDGAISFRIRGRVVERPVANRWAPVPGTAEHGWTGRDPVADERLHRWRNPAQGYLVTANNRVSDEPPYISLDFAGSSRHDRIVELLDALEAGTVEDMAAIHADTLSLSAPRYLRTIDVATPATEGGRAALALLTGWDHVVAADSAAAAVYGAFRRHWIEEVGERLRIGSPALGEPGWPSPAQASRQLASGALTMLRGEGWRTVPGLDDEGDLTTLVGELLDRVAADLADRLGPDATSWRWDQVHTMVSPHPLATARPELAHLHPPVDGTAGDGDTVRSAATVPLSGDRAAASSVARYVYDLADWDRSGWVVPHGVSGVRGSGHDLDQRAAWLACELLPMAYTASAVEALAVSTESVGVTDPV